MEFDKIAEILKKENVDNEKIKDVIDFLKEITEELKYVGDLVKTNKLTSEVKINKKIINQMFYVNEYDQTNLIGLANTPEMVKILIDNGSDPNIKNKKGNTGFFLSIANIIGEVGMFGGNKEGPKKVDILLSEMINEFGKYNGKKDFMNEIGKISAGKFSPLGLMFVFDEEDEKNPIEFPKAIESLLKNDVKITSFVNEDYKSDDFLDLLKEYGYKQSLDVILNFKN